MPENQNPKPAAAPANLVTEDTVSILSKLETPLSHIMKIDDEELELMAKRWYEMKVIAGPILLPGGQKGGDGAVSWRIETHTRFDQNDPHGGSVTIEADRIFDSVARTDIVPVKREFKHADRKRQNDPLCSIRKLEDRFDYRYSEDVWYSSTWHFNMGHFITDVIVTGRIKQTAPLYLALLG